MPILKIKTLFRIYQNKAFEIDSEKITLTGCLPHNAWWSYIQPKNTEKNHDANA